MVQIIITKKRNDTKATGPTAPAPSGPAPSQEGVVSHRHEYQKKAT